MIQAIGIEPKKRNIIRLEIVKKKINIVKILRMSNAENHALNIIKKET